jgi:hypothetical protein
MPRGLGWIVFPIIGLWSGAALGYSYQTLSLTNIKFEHRTESPELKLWVGLAAVWIVSVSIFFLVFDPFDTYRWYREHWLKFTTILAGPPTVGLAVIFVMRWAWKRS